MYQKIDFKDFIAKLEERTGFDPELLQEIVFDLFVQIRTNTECGLWVEIEGFGSFHPLWYDLKKHKDDTEDSRILQTLHTQNSQLLLQEQKLKKEQLKKKAFHFFKTLGDKKRRKKIQKTIEKEGTFSRQKQTLSKKEEAPSSREEEALRAKQIRLRQAQREEQRKAQIKKIDKDLMQKPEEHGLVTFMKKSYALADSIKSKIAAGMLMGVVVITVMLTSKAPEVQTDLSDSKETHQKEPKKLYKSFKKEDKPKAYVEDHYYRHKVVKGDNLYTLSKQLYGQSKYWPLIYVKNITEIVDVDKIYPHQELDIPRIQKDGSADKALAEVYIKAYKSYKSSGKVNKAHWLLYWSRQNVDAKLLEKFSHEIADEDLKKVQAYINRFDP